MSFHLDSDAVSLIALIVSLVALLIAFLQVIQQYAATASDYRRCSARTMGGWAKYTRRAFIWSEVRFEITFSVPHIKLGDSPPPALKDVFWENVTSEAYYEVRAPDASRSFLKPRYHYRFSHILKACVTMYLVVAMKLKLMPPETKPNQSLREKRERATRRVLRVLRALRIPVRMLVEAAQWLPRKVMYAWLFLLSPPWDPNLDDEFPNPVQDREKWYLSLEGAAREGVCSWLLLLHDSQATTLHYVIAPTRLSFDYLPPDITRPLATAERATFLAILTALGTEWKDRGVGEVFPAQSPRNQIEISKANIRSVGTVYSYNRSFNDSDSSKPLLSDLDKRVTSGYYVGGAGGAKPLFNSFDLETFEKPLLTWSGHEIRRSLRKMLAVSDAHIAEYFGDLFTPDGLNIGIGELIAGWSEGLTMPRTKGDTDLNYMSEAVFSSSSIGCTFGMPLLSKILRRKEKLEERETQDKHGLGENTSGLQPFIKMVDDYYASLKADREDGKVLLNRLFTCLDCISAVPKRSNVLLFRPKPYEHYSALLDEALRRLTDIGGNEQLRHPTCLEDFEALERMGFLQGKNLEDLERLRAAHEGIEFLEDYDDVIEECFWLIVELDKKYVPGDSRQIATGLLRQYAEKEADFMRGPKTSNDADIEGWVCDAVLLTASAAVGAMEELSRNDPGDNPKAKWGNLIIERIIRGVLWTFGNGNAPGWDPLAKDEDKGADRRLECSLSSTWLEQKDTVYIS